MPLSGPFHPLRLKDRPVLEPLLRERESFLSAYSFAAHYLWHRTLNYFWTARKETIYLFAGYEGLIYMPVPPLGKLTPEAVETAFGFMEKTNRNPKASRIENVDAEQEAFYRSLGYTASPGDPEYLYRRTDMAGLPGNRFKSKRASCNHFEREHPEAALSPYAPADRGGCLHLHDRWFENRRKKFSDPYYRALLEDSREAHRIALSHARSLGLTGRVLRIEGEIQGYTFGAPRGEETFCILLEIAEPGTQGLSQYLFREFCREASGYPIVNVLDDSGLENLRRVKLSYHPFKTAIPYTIRRA
ncbi:MAG: DUF2156 domain-containing protein [Nitrospirae bacterium]|nr:DUF2156 domain-containing protein [Nitrospirota bacterium]